VNQQVDTPSGEESTSKSFLEDAGALSAIVDKFFTEVEIEAVTRQVAKKNKKNQDKEK
jgi:hypothetical protein